MNRTIRNLIVAAPLATIALTLVPVGAATAGPNGPVIVIQPNGGDPEPDPELPIAIPDPEPQDPQDKAAPKPKPDTQPQAPQGTSADTTIAATEVADTAAVAVDSVKGSPDAIDRSDSLFVAAPTETTVVSETEGGLDLTWLLIGGGIVTASGIAVAARKRQHNA